jgi:hypothetical protein
MGGGGRQGAEPNDTKNVWSSLQFLVPCPGTIEAGGQSLAGTDWDGFTKLNGFQIESHFILKSSIFSVLL